MKNKKRSSSALAKLNSGSSKSKDAVMDKDTRLVSLKNQVRRKVAANKSVVGRVIENAFVPEGSAESIKAEELSEQRTAKTKIRSQYSVAKKTGSSIKNASHVSEIEGAVETTIVEGSEDNVKTPSPKRKRGADMEIIQEYKSSGGKNLSRFRPRKELPAFRMVDLGERDGYLIVGRRVKVYWSGSRRWFTGRIQAFNRRKKLHSILYEDGDKEVLDLWKEQFELEIFPSEGFNLKVEPKSKRKVAALDGQGVSADTSLEESFNVSEAEYITRNAETKKERASRKVAKKENSKLKGENAEVKNGEDSVVDIDADMHPEKLHGSENVPEIAKEATRLLNAQTSGLQLHSHIGTFGLDNGEGNSGKTGKMVVDEPSKEDTTTKLTKTYIRRRRNVTKDARESLQVHHQKGDSKCKTLADEGSKDNFVIPSGARAATSYLNAGRLTTLMDGVCSGDANDERAKQEKTEMITEDAVKIARNARSLSLAQEKVKAGRREDDC